MPFRKLSYCKDDCVMHPHVGALKIFDSLCMSMLTATLKYLSRNFVWAFAPIDPMNVRTQFEVRSFTRSYNRG